MILYTTRFLPNLCSREIYWSRRRCCTTFKKIVTKNSNTPTSAYTNSGSQNWLVTLSSLRSPPNAWMPQSLHTNSKTIILCNGFETEKHLLGTNNCQSTMRWIRFFVLRFKLLLLGFWRVNFWKRFSDERWETSPQHWQTTKVGLLIMSPLMLVDTASNILQKYICENSRTAREPTGNPYCMKLARIFTLWERNRHSCYLTMMYPFILLKQF